MEQKYDKIFYNGKIFTSWDDKPYAEAMAVKGGKIAWIGLNSQIEASWGTAVDLQGRRVLPGLIDSHMHAIMLANCCRQISALPPKINSIKELIEEIAHTRALQTADAWIQGWGYDEGKLKEQRSLTRYDLDQGASDVPVMVLRTCGHVCVVNSKALEMAGITSSTEDPEGGKIGRDENGQPNGILYENARTLVTDLLPTLTVDDLADNLTALNHILLSQGLTAVTDMGEFFPYDYEEIFKQAIKKGYKIKTAVYYMWDEVKEKKDFRISKEEQDAARPLRIAGVKLIGDGSVSGRTAWCDQPYVGSEEFGLPVCTEEDMQAALHFAKENQCQLSIHAMGGKTIKRALDLTVGEKPWLLDERPSVRIEHVTMPRKADIKRAAEAGIVFVTQPIFLYAEIESYLKNLGEERTKETYPIADWLEEGVRFCFSSDAPATSWATPSDPFTCIKGAVTRCAYDGTECGKRHRVDVETALRLYTSQAAPITGFSNAGMLKPGKDADFIVLDRDILDIPVQEIDQVQVEQTYIDGRLVYQKQEESISE